ncbi:hypothetical protein, partial [Thalassotalea sp. ND16A]|uniref:hypothetical protein n=1 Tax=Thalassotalea sp. ND16A TaxID=1535422 RepID=UPI00051A1F7D
ATSGFTAPQVSSDSAVVIRLTISQGNREISTDTSITVKNQVTTTPPKDDGGGGGGGAINLYWLLVLLWFAGHARTRRLPNLTF